MNMKDDYIRIRVTKEQKELLKKIAKEQKMSLTDFIVVTTENLAKQKAQYIKHKDIIENRAMRTEEKILELRKKMKL